MPTETALWIRDDDEPPKGKPPPAKDGYPIPRNPREILYFRCLPCAGSGKLLIFDEGERRGRAAWCPLCVGSGRVALW